MSIYYGRMQGYNILRPHNVVEHYNKWAVHDGHCTKPMHCLHDKTQCIICSTIGSIKTGIWKRVILGFLRSSL